MWCDLLHITYPTQFETPSTLSQNKKTPPSYLRLYGEHKSGQRLVGDGRKRNGEVKFGRRHPFTTTNDHT
jgi:hypothetical protein